jgi:hypothetical protein
MTLMCRSSTKSAPLHAISAWDNELYEWWGPSPTSGDVLVDSLCDELHTHNKKSRQLQADHHRLDVAALLATTS